MNRRNSNAKVMVYIKSISLPKSKPVLYIVAGTQRFKAASKRLYNPSVGKLRAWADPFRDTIGIITT